MKTPMQHKNQYILCVIVHALHLSVSIIFLTQHIESLSKIVPHTFLLIFHNTKIHPAPFNPLQTIALLAFLKFERNIDGPHLIVVPLSVLPSWMEEFKKWCPTFRVQRLHSSNACERERIKKEASHPFLKVPLSPCT